MSEVPLSQRDYVPQIKGVQYVRTLGQGSFAFVKLAHLKKNPAKAFAIKFINRQYCHQFGLKDDDISRELMIHKSCHGHPNIIQLYDAGSDKNYLWMIMELALSGDLFDKIEPDVGVDEQVAHFYFHQLIGAIDFIHKLGVAHRDIKPENILLDKRGNLKIADFGLACVYKKKSGKQRLAYKACGSPPYMAPEVTNSEGYRPDLTDIWSCGVLLYVLLTGETLWEEPTSHDPDFKHYSEHGDNIYMCYPWSRLSTEVIALLRSMLKIDSESRVLMERIRKHPWVNKSNALANSSGLCENPKVLLDRLLSSLKIDLSDDEFLKATQQATQATQMSQAYQQELATSQPVFEAARFVMEDNEPVNFASQQDVSEYSKRRRDKKDSELMKYQLISKDPAVLQFINSGDRNSFFKDEDLLGAVKDYFKVADRLTRFFSILPIESLIPIILDSLHQSGVPTTDDNFNGISNSSFKLTSESIKLSVHTIDSRRMNLRGAIKISKISNLLLKKIEFVKSKGDPLEWRKFFKKITVLCREAVYIDQSIV